MLVNVNVIYYVHVCEQARWARSAGNSAIENLCIIIITLNELTVRKTPSYLLVTLKFSTSVSTVVDWVLNSLSVLYSYS